MLIENSAWKSEKNLNEINVIWNKLEKVVYRTVKIRLLKEGIVNKEEDIDFEADLDFPQDWKITTTIIRVYEDRGIFTKEEIVKELIARICILKDRRRLEPSFKITVNGDRETLSFDCRSVERVLKEAKALEDASAETVLGEAGARELMIFSAELEARFSKIVKNTSPILDQLGFSEEEKMITLHQAVKHKDFKEGMAPENIARIAMGIRRDDPFLED